MMCLWLSELQRKDTMTITLAQRSHGGQRQRNDSSQVIFASQKAQTVKCSEGDEKTASNGQNLWFSVAFNFKQNSWSHFILIDLWLTPYKLSVDIQSHVNNSYSAKVSVYYQYVLLQQVINQYLTICSLSQHLLSWLSVIVSWKSAVNSFHF